MYWVPAAGLPEERVNTDLGDNGIDESNVFDARAILEWTLPGDYSVTSLTGYKKFNFHYLEDYDGGPTLVNNYGQMNDVEYWSQELRLNSPNDGKVTWFAGASIYEEKIDGVFDYHLRRGRALLRPQRHRGAGLQRPGRGLRRPELRGLLGRRHRPGRHPP